MNLSLHRLYPWTLSCVCLCAVVGMSGDAPLEKNSVKELIGKLESNSREDRVGAERELIHRGAAVLEELPSPEANLMPGVREALLRVRTEIEQRKAIESVRPSIITLSGTLPLRKVLEELEQQTGNRLDVSRIPEPLLHQKREIDLQRETYWSSVEVISRLYRLRLMAEVGKALELVPRTEGGPLAVDGSGSVRVEWVGNEVHSRKGEHELLRMKLQFVLEPRLRGLYGTFRPRDLQLVSQGGEKLTPLDPEATFEIPCGEEGKVLDIGIDFKLSNKQRFRTLQLQGTAELEIAAGEERFEFSRLGDPNPQALRMGNVAVTFEPLSAESDAKLKRFGLLVRYDTAGPPFESHRLWIFHNRTFVKSTNGSEVTSTRRETVLQQGRIVGLKYDFSLTDKELEGAMFVYVAPTRILTHRVPFIFPEIRFPDTP